MNYRKDAAKEFMKVMDEVKFCKSCGVQVEYCGCVKIKPTGASKQSELTDEVKPRRLEFEFATEADAERAMLFVRALYQERDTLAKELEKTKKALRDTADGRPSEWAYVQLKNDFDALANENDCLMTELEILTATRNKLRAQLDEAKRVIEFYANRLNWSDGVTLKNDDDHDEDWGVFEWSGGKLAREFLKKLEGKE